MKSVYYYNILLTKPFNNSFTYKSEFVLDVGEIVEVNFNNRVVIGVMESKIAKPDIEDAKIKDIIERLNFRVSSSHLKFIEFCAQYNMAEKGSFLKMLLSHADVLKKPDRYILPDREKYVLPNTLAKLDRDQQVLYEKILADSDHFSVSVLQGVTGSGKTEVYLNLAAEIIRNGGQVLILLPEIALGSQLVARYEARLGIKPLVWNSKEGVRSKKITWLNTVAKNYPLVVGARSSLFLPMKNLKMIIIDEEHDASFKQEEGVRYNARDMAVVLAKLNNIPLLLASATPSIETVHNAKLGKYSLFELKSRYGKATLPEIKIIDTAKNKLPSGMFIAQESQEVIKKQITADRQILIYLNRRGYAPVSFCRTCGYQYECPHCSSNLVKHKHNDFIICHYCGYKSHLVNECPGCKSTEGIFEYGPGVERIEEEIQELFPDAKTIVFSSDTTNPKTLKKQVKQIQDGEFDIIIGTQMVTKGFHFPKLTMVLILDFDWSVKGFDLRAHERVYQSLYQVSGRAGREEEKGQVVIQTMEPDSHLLDILKNDSHQQFVRTELEEREMAQMPPFSSIGIISLEAKNERTILQYLRDLDGHSLEDDNIKILGPSQAPIFKLNQKFRYRYVVVSYQKNNKLQKYMATWLNSVPKPRAIKLKIDIDPISFS